MRSNDLNLTFISDTHGQEPNLSGGDILFHCGDLSENGFRVEIIKTLNYLHEQLSKYKHVILTAGNHDLWIERHPEEFKNACLSAGLIGLINESVEVEGLKIWGSPNTLTYHDWAFNSTSSEIVKIWDRIPTNTDVVISHSPPYDILDKSRSGLKLGCIDLFHKIKEVSPLIHSFGHVHESRGFQQEKETLFINAATKVVDLVLLKDNTIILK